MLMAKANMFLLLFLVSWLSSALASVGYDHRAIIVNGKRRILISGSIHYPRSTPEVLSMPMQFIFIPAFQGIQIYIVLLAQILIFVGFTDVAGFNSEGQRWRLGCDTDLCVLEWA